MTNPKALLPEVIRIAREAAHFIQTERSTFNYGRVEKKGLNDLVSYVDKQAEKMIVERLREITPEAGFIAEEETETARAEFNWVIDPLDGTTNFIHGFPPYAVSIALEKNNQILLGVVHEVTRDENFSAVKGEGAFMNQDRIQVSQRTTLTDALVGTGFPVYNFERLDHYTEALQYFIRNTHGVRRAGAASADLCYVACGRLDAFFEYNLKPWDVAAGALIVEEAGGLVHDFRSGQDWLFGKEISATNGHVDKEFLEALRRCFSV